MVVSVSKPAEELLEMLDGYKNMFIVACGGCPVGCDSGGMKRVDELTEFFPRMAKKLLEMN